MTIDGVHGVFLVLDDRTVVGDGAGVDAASLGASDNAMERGDAVIQACVLLERALAHRGLKTHERERVPLKGLLYRAEKAELLSVSPAVSVSVEIRNAFAHGGRCPSADEARYVLRVVANLISILRGRRVAKANRSLDAMVPQPASGLHGVRLDLGDGSYVGNHHGLDPSTLAVSRNPSERANAVIQTFVLLEAALEDRGVKARVNEQITVMELLRRAENSGVLKVSGPLEACVKTRNLYAHRGHYPGPRETEDVVRVVAGVVRALLVVCITEHCGRDARFLCTTCGRYEDKQGSISFAGTSRARRRYCRECFEAAGGGLCACGAVVCGPCLAHFYSRNYDKGPWVCADCGTVFCTDCDATRGALPRDTPFVDDGSGILRNRWLCATCAPDAPISQVSFSDGLVDDDSDLQGYRHR